MDIRKHILKAIRQKGEARAADIVQATGFSRAYINRFFKELQEAGQVVLVGKANRAHYILPGRRAVEAANKKFASIRKILVNKELSEDFVLDGIKQNSGIFSGLGKNAASILEYAFTEMLNNAIEHSRSKNIEVRMARDSAGIRFDVVDKGVGIFRNIMHKRHLKSELEAIQDLLKGKQTTSPDAHSGEGIFFTSKAADTLIIQSSKKKLIFNNVLGDIFIKDVPETKGTKVIFTLSRKPKTNLESIFSEYSGDAFEFSKTYVAVRLYKMGYVYISRSQARRILSGLEKFKHITLDFKDVDSIGQAFADEIFRVWQAGHPGIKIQYQNADENVEFMIKRSLR